MYLHQMTVILAMTAGIDFFIDFSFVQISKYIAVFISQGKIKLRFITL